MKLGHQKQFYLVDEERFLGTEDFIDATIHRIGEARRVVRGDDQTNQEFNADALIEAAEKVCRIPRGEFCGSGKSVGAVTAKEMLVLTGCRAGASLKMLSEITGLSSSATSRRNEAAKSKVRENDGMSKLADSIWKQYRQRE